MKRSRGMSALLVGITNSDLPTSKHSCMDRTNKRIKKHAEKVVLAPRGASKVSSGPGPSEQQYSLRKQVSKNYSTSKLNFKQLLDKRRNVIEQGFEHLCEYTEWRIPFVTHKAIALQVLAASVLQGNGILASCDLAASGTSFSARTVRQWASDVIINFSVLQAVLRT